MQIAAVIPTLNEGHRLASCLEHLRPLQLHEVIVVDGGSTDHTCAIARRSDVRVLTAPRGRALQLDTGASASTAEVLWFLHADTRLPAQSLAALRRTLAVPGVVGGAFHTRTVADADPLWFECLLPLADLRARRTRLPYGDQALFCLRSAYRAVGGFPPWPIFEDVGLAQRLWTVGRLAAVDQCVTVSARRYARAPLYYAAVMMTFPALWHIGVPLEWLSRAYGDPR